MKFAIVNGQREEAQRSLSGKCPACDQPMVAKCGEVRMWHWAHQGKRFCDPWWENESEWHRAWKAQFPAAWQEVVHPVENGTKHIADVKTERGWVIEFQRSNMRSEERRSRDVFYSKLIWVVDGTRRKRDEAQFVKALNEGASVGQTSHVRQVWSNECALLREWAVGHAPVFFDFGGELLWWLFAGRPDRPMYVWQVPRAAFIGIHRGLVAQTDFDEIMKEVHRLVADYEAQKLNRGSADPLLGFRQNMVGRRRRL